MYEIIGTDNEVRLSELLIVASTAYGVGIGEPWLKECMAPMKLEFGSSLSNCADRVQNSLKDTQFQSGCETCKKNIVATIILYLSCKKES